jgi:hypothetical protein
MGSPTNVANLKTEGSQVYPPTPGPQAHSETKKKGDGYWCPKCRAIGKYSWLEQWEVPWGTDLCPGIDLGWHNHGK